MLLGMVFGAISKFFFDGKHLRFDPLVFFYGLLPIIIFNAGYSLKKKVPSVKLLAVTFIPTLGSAVPSLMMCLVILTFTVVLCAFFIFYKVVGLLM